MRSKMFPKENKCCFVPECKNTSINSSNKVFLTVPRDFSRKKLWFQAANRDLPTSKAGFYCCEDHFNLETDMENYVQYKLMGGKIFLKPHVVPHIFIHQEEDGKRMERNASSKMQKVSAEDVSVHIFESQFVPQKNACSISVGISVKPSFRSKYISCNLDLEEVRHVATSVKFPSQRNTSTSSQNGRKKKQRVRKQRFSKIPSGSDTEDSNYRCRGSWILT